METNPQDSVYPVIKEQESFWDIKGQKITPPAEISGGLTKIEHFALSAPNDVPHWFATEPDTPEPTVIQALSKKVTEDDIQESIATHNAWFNDHQQKTYFAWRIFYAKRLMEELNKEE